MPNDVLASYGATCPTCAGPVSAGARFCRQCGASLSGNVASTACIAPSPAPPPPSVPTPPPDRPPIASPPRQAARQGRWLWRLALGAGGSVLLCLCAGILGILLVNQWMAAAPTAAPSVPKSTVDPAMFQALEKKVGQLQAACTAGDVSAAIELTHPAARSEYGPIFQAHRTELKRLADLLATRQLVDMTGLVAEYQVTENGNTFYVTFENVDGQWYLSTL